MNFSKKKDATPVQAAPSRVRVQHATQPLALSTPRAAAAKHSKPAGLHPRPAHPPLLSLLPIACRSRTHVHTRAQRPMRLRPMHVCMPSPPWPPSLSASLSLLSLYYRSYLEYLVKVLVAEGEQRGSEHGADEHEEEDELRVREAHLGGVHDGLAHHEDEDERDGRQEVGDR